MQLKEKDTSIIILNRNNRYVVRLANVYSKEQRNWWFWKSIFIAFNK